MANDQRGTLMRAPEAAEYLKLSTSTLAKLRHRREGPAFLKVGKRVVAYRLEDLNKWIAQINPAVALED